VPRPTIPVLLVLVAGCSDRGLAVRGVASATDGVTEATLAFPMATQLVDFECGPPGDMRLHGTCSVLDHRVVLAVLQPGSGGLRAISVDHREGTSTLLWTIWNDEALIGLHDGSACDIQVDAGGATATVTVDCALLTTIDGEPRPVTVAAELSFTGCSDRECVPIVF
jgi:hypothetical protein